MVAGPGAQPRAILLGRLALYGPSAARLHEEILPVTAIWQEAAHGRTRSSLRPLGRDGEETTLVQLEAALSSPKRISEAVRARLIGTADDDARSLETELRQRAEARRLIVEAELSAQGEREAASLTELLESQRARICEAGRISPIRLSLSLPGITDAEIAQRRADRRHWHSRLEAMDEEMRTEPGRIREGYRVRAARLEMVGLLYLWPMTN